VADWTYIANLALAKLGSTQLTDLLTEETETARTLRAVYQGIADEVVYSRPWTAARYRTSLTAMSPGPPFGYAFQYQLPSDPWCLRVFKAGEECDEGGAPGFENWGGSGCTIEGRAILTDRAPPLPVILIVRLDNPDLYAGLLQTAVALRLAWAVAYKLTNSTELEERMEAAYDKTLREAGSADAQQGMKRRKPEPDSILRARY